MDKQEYEKGDTDTAIDTSGYIELKKGEKGDAVLALQSRLAELKYLSVKPDGNYGSKSEASVKEFQTANGLEATGIASPETQANLFSDDAPVAIVYEKLDYKKVIRDPNSFIDQKAIITGRVSWVVEHPMEDGTVVVTLAVATKGSYNDPQGNLLRYTYV